MILHQLSTIKLPQILRICIYAGLLCAFFGVASDAQAQSKDAVCAALDLSALDCTYITGVSTTLPSGLTLPVSEFNGLGDVSAPTNVPWFVSNLFHRSQDGEDSMRSGDIGNRQASCLVLAVNALPVGSQLRFSLRTDSEGAFDRLMFAVDNRILIRHFSASMGDRFRGWEGFRFTFSTPPPPPRNLTWCYLKERSDSTGADSGWVDWLDFDVLNDPSVSRALVCSALDVSAEDCSLILDVSTALPISLMLPREGCCDTLHTGTPWIESSVATEGSNSLRSGDINDLQGSCLVLKAILPANTRISFSLRTSSQGRYDRLAFFAGNVTAITNFSAPEGSNTKDWTQQEVVLANNVRNLTWCYLKNLTISEVDDSGWIDDLSFTIPDLTIDQVCLALDMSTEDCTSISSVSSIPPADLTLPNSPSQVPDTSILTAIPWSVSTHVATQGDSSLQTGEINHLQASCLVLGIKLSVGTRINFSLRTDSQGQEDRLFFAADNRILIGNFSANRRRILREWEELEPSLPNTASKLIWCYLKNSDTDGGSDTGWVDNLSFTLPPTCQALDMSLQECSLITNISYDPPASPWVISSTATNGDTSLRSGDIDGTGQSCLILNMSFTDRTLVQFFRRVSSQPADELYFSVDGVRQEYSLRPAATTNLRDWSREVHILFDLRGDKDLRWCYIKDASGSEGLDGAFIDDLSLVAPPAAPLNRELACLVLDMSLEDCQLVRTAASEPATPAWYISYFNSEGGFSNGETSLRSDPVVDHNQTSCLVLGVTLPGDHTIRFFLRTDSEAVNDFVYFAADGIRLVENYSAASGSDLRDFEQMEVLLPGNAKTLKWCYTKNGSGDAGNDSGWLDRLSFSAVDDPEAVALTRGTVCQALDLSTENCALIDSVAADPPKRPWVLSSTATEGSFALRSGAIDGDETSCLVLGITLPDDRNLRFSLRTDSEAVNDFLYFEADGTRLVDRFSAPQGSTLRDWEQMDILISDSISSLKWCYTKNGSTSSGADSGWLDALTFTVPGVTKEPLCTALDLSANNCSQIQSVSFDPPSFPWRITTDTSVAGSSSLRSGAIDDGEQSCLVLNLSLPANSVITLASRTSSQGGFDQLQFAADQTRLDTLSAAIGTTEKPWAHTTYYLPAAATALRWCYVKDSTASSGQDSAWIDKLSFSTSNISYKSRICAALDMTEALCSMVNSISYNPLNLLWVITSQTSVLGGSSLRSADIGDDERTCLTPSLTLSPLPANALIRFSVRSDSEAVNDFLLFESSGGNRLIDNFSATNGSLRDWEPQEFRLPNSAPSPAWCYEKNGSISSGADSVWLDALSVIIPLTTEDVCLALDLSAQECALITGVAADPPASPWQISPIATESSTSLRSGDIDDDQQSCLVLNLSPLAGPTVVQFSLRISSEPLADRLLFAADGQFLDYRLRPESATVLRDWSRELVIVPAGTTSLSWCYRKDDMTRSGEDSAWIDDLSITSTTVAALDRELVCLLLDIDIDGCGIIRSVAFDPPASPWLISTTATEGDFSLRSADIDDSESSCLVLGIALSVDRGIRFSLRTDSEAVNDHLSFAAGGQELIETFAAADGSTLRDWEPQQFLLPAGDSTLRWCYNKNGDTSSGADGAWLDALSFVSAGLVQFEPLCEALDLLQAQCANIRSVTYEPPQSLWLTTATESARGASALVSPALGSGESSCLTVEFHSPLTLDSPVAFDWRTTSQSDQDTLQFQVGTQQSQIANMSEWQTETVILDSAETTIRWCYSQNSAADGQTARAWLDNLSLLTLTDRYTVQIAVIPTSLLVTEDSDGFRFQVTVTAVSETLPPPTDWVLIITGMDNITAADTTYALVFSGNSAQVDAIATFDTPLLPSSILLSLEDRPSLLNTTGTSLVFQLPAVRRLAILEIITSTSVTQSTPDAMLVIAVTVTATDNFGDPFEPAGLTLMVEDAGNAEVSQSNYALSFTDGLATATITVGLTRRGTVGSITLSVASGDIQSTASITLNPAPRVLVSITLSAASSNLAQTTANTTVAAVLMLAALDNYGEPSEAGDVRLQIEATNAAIVTPSFTVAIATTATVLQTIEILPQNELDTTVTVSILRGTLDESVQLLPDGGIQIAVRVLRVLRQLQLGLVDRVSPLRQVDRSLPIRANIRLIGLDQFGQPSAFSEVMLIITAEPLETTATLNPQQLTATGPEGTQTMLEVTFPGNNPMETMITIAIVGQAAGVTTNSLVVQALPDLRDALQPLHVDAPETGVTELDLIVALRWLTDQQSSTASLVVNLTIPSTSVMTAGIENLRQLFTDPANLDRVDLNGDKRANQLDLRILVRWLSGLRGSALTEQGTSADLEGIIQLLLGSAP